MLSRRCILRANAKFNDNIGKILTTIKDAGTWKAERVITSPQGAQIGVAGTEAKVINFCANNYLGLASDPQVMAGAHKYIDSHGAGLSSVRFICGTQDIHKKLEQTISDFLEREDTILYPSCFDANAGVFECVLTAEDAIISDSLNHASIIDGVRLCKAKRFVYQHTDMKDLEEVLKNTQDRRLRLIATDGVFSMDGDIAPLDKIVELAEKYDAAIFVDDCHATGFFGPGGRGTPHHFGVHDKIDILHSTLGKAMGGASGGFSSGSKELVALQRQRSRPYLFSNSIAPSVVGATQAAFDLLISSSAMLDQLRSNTDLFRSGLKKAGFNVLGHDSCPIVPVMLGDAKLASEFADEMMSQGIYVIGFSFPVVPTGKARIRVQLSASHSTADVQKAIDAFTTVGKAKGVIQ
eukprot:TRINITY_DN63927_c0_g2_i1.p2 TRINITY_DN63927_c0_g2~~TRINITY_DN63927_c0_g2_i1.p2  ORF type:complete len:408 (+),score=59.69 TRINITY_DN63927_c0_g2_i1:25-1248(+)